MSTEPDETTQQSLSEREFVRPTGPEIAALRNFLWTVAGDDVDDSASLVEVAVAAGEVIGDLSHEIDSLNGDIDRIQGLLPDEKTSKLEKWEKIVNHAENKHNGVSPGVKLDYREVMAATGVTQKYAYTIMREMGQAFEWASYRNTTEPYSLKIEMGSTEWGEMIAAVHNNLSE